MIRNLTSHFLRARSEAATRRRKRPRAVAAPPSGGLEDAPLVTGEPSDAGWAALRDSLPPAWVDTVDAVQEDIRQIRERMGQLDITHKERLRLVGFAEEEERAKEREVCM
jgi:hypothetical protein